MRDSRPRSLLRLLLSAFAVVLVIKIATQVVGPGPDIPTSGLVRAWVDIGRIGLESYLGPFPLLPPRLSAAQCSVDGRKAMLTYTAPITGETTYVLMEFLDTMPITERHHTVADASLLGAAGVDCSDH